MAGHEPHDDARIDAAAQEGPDRDIGDHLAGDGVIEGVKESGGCLLEIARRGCKRRIGGRRRDVPVKRLSNRALVNRQEVAGAELADVPEDRPGRRDVVEAEIEVERLRVDFLRHVRIGEQSLEFRGEDETLGVGIIDEGLDADRVAREEKGAG